MIGVGRDPSSAVERKPAQLVAQPLVVQHKLSDLVGELSALPLALQPAGRLALVASRCRPRRLDRIGRGTELVGSYMADRSGLAGSVRGMPCRPTQVSGRGVCMAGRSAGLCPRDLTPRPGTPHVDRMTWTVVLRPRVFEMVQHVLRAVSRPDPQKAVMVVLEAAAATHCDEPRIPDLGEDHTLALAAWDLGWGNLDKRIDERAQLRACRLVDLHAVQESHACWCEIEACGGVGGIDRD